MNMPEAEADSPAGKWRDLSVRVISAVILIPFVLAIVWLGGWWFAGLIILLGILAAREYARMIRPGESLILALLAMAGLIGGLCLPLFGFSAAFGLLALVWAGSVLFLAMQGSRDVFAYLGAAYVGLPCLALVYLRFSGDAGAIAIYWLFAVVWGADTLAYFAGRMIGGPKLWPAVSPKKTWAGLLGAIVGAMLSGFAVMALAGREASFALMLAAGFLAIIEQGGDFYESALKRRAGVKDSGRLIPGHGGILDRVDGLLFAAMGSFILALAGLVSW